MERESWGLCPRHSAEANGTPARAHFSWARKPRAVPTSFLEASSPRPSLVCPVSPFVMTTSNLFAGLLPATKHTHEAVSFLEVLSSQSKPRALSAGPGPRLPGLQERPELGV